MSDSFPPDDEGPDPCAGQDLDGWLSGENCYVPDALRPVVASLDALRAAPVRAELLGEAAARAYFRKAMLGGEGEPARPDAGADEARTLILSAEAPGDRPRAVRHRHRRPPRRGRWQAKALAGVAAAAVVVVGAAALTGTFSGTGGHPAAGGRSQRTASAATRATVPGSNGVDGTGKPEPSAKPTPATKAPQQSGGGPSPTDLCREYFDSLAYPGRHANPAVREIARHLNSLADGQGVVYYCMRLLQPWYAPQGPGKFPGGLPGLQGSQGNQNPHGSQNPQGFQGTKLSPGHGGIGNSGSGGNGLGSGMRTGGS